LLVAKYLFIDKFGCYNSNAEDLINFTDYGPHIHHIIDIALSNKYYFIYVWYDHHRFIDFVWCSCDVCDGYLTKMRLLKGFTCKFSKPYRLLCDLDNNTETVI